LGKVVSQDELICLRENWRRDCTRMAFTYGIFDLLHPGHVRLLEQAADLGDILVVGIESDARVRERFASRKDSGKSATRPIIPGPERSEILAALAAVDYVVEFDEPTLQELIKRLAPDVFVVGDEPGLDESSLAGGRMQSAGVKTVRIPLEPGYSTSRLVDRIKQLHT